VQRIVGAVFLYLGKDVIERGTGGFVRVELGCAGIKQECCCRVRIGIVVEKTVPSSVQSSLSAASLSTNYGYCSCWCW
jgi:hypothetical protein